MDHFQYLMKYNPGDGRIRQITVIGDADVGKEAFRFAQQVGEAIAKLGYVLITGGKGGIMEATSKGAYLAGGVSIGILPSVSVKDANQYCNIVIPTGMGHARNVITALSCDAIVSIGGGAGTLSEICFGWIHQKPIFVFDQFDGWSKKLSGQQLDARYQAKIERCASIEELVEKLHNLDKH